jgi:hypothetical protein
MQPVKPAPAKPAVPALIQKRLATANGVRD